MKSANADDTPDDLISSLQSKDFIVYDLILLAGFN